MKSSAQFSVSYEGMAQGGGGGGNFWECNPVPCEIKFLETGNTIFLSVLGYGPTISAACAMAGEQCSSLALLKSQLSGQDVRWTANCTAANTYGNCYPLN